MLLASAWLFGLVCAGGMSQSATRIAGVVALSTGTLLAGLGLVRLESDEARKPARALHVRMSAAVLLSAGWLAGASVGPVRAIERFAPSGLASLELEVLETQRDAQGAMRSLARVVSGRRIEDGQAFEPGSLLRVAPVELRAGTRVRLPAQVSAAQVFRNPSPHPEWPRARVVTGRAWVSDADAVSIVDAGGFRSQLERARAHVSERLYATLPLRTAGVASALVLGEGGAVEEPSQATIRAAGLAHVLAVSGLHVTLLVGLLVAGIRVALLHVGVLAERYEVRRIACAVGAPLALIYAAFAGGAPSAWRAAVTAALGWTLLAIGRRPDSAAVCALSVLVLGAFDPREALRPGFLLSVLATAAILAQAPPQPTLRGHLIFALRIACATTLATAPLVLWCFGQVPILGVLANLALVPIGSCALLPIASVHALLASLGLPSALTAQLLTTCVEGFLSGCAVFSDLGPAWLLPPPDLAQGIVLCGSVGLLMLSSSVRGALIVLCVTALALGACELRLRASERPTGVLRVTFLDVGQGDAALIDLPDGRLMLVDAGGSPGGGRDPGEAVLVPLLQARRRRDIDIAVLTHPHPDHYGGMHALLPHVRVRELWDSGQAETEAELEPSSREAATLIASMRARGTRVRTPRELCGRALHAANATVEVLAPCPTYDSAHDANDNSLVLRIDYGKTSFLLMGDAELEEERELLESRARLRADVLKVGHHGSRTSSSAGLLAAVQPAITVVSAGATNRFGHPHAEVIGRLSQAKSRVIELAKVGGTVALSDGERITITPYAAPSFEAPSFER